MKRVVILFLILTLLLPAAACGKKENDPKESEIPQMTDITETEPDYYIPTTVIPAGKKDAFRLVGRAGIGNDGIHLDWTWAEAAFCGWFDGEIRADLDLAYSYQGDKGVGLLRVVVDEKWEDAKLITLEGDDTVLIDEVLADVERGYHTVSLFKCSQAMSAGINVSQIRFTGTLDKAPGARKKNILVIGDSISCGAGAVDTGRAEAVSDDGWYSFGAVLGRELDADVSVFAVSGWGIACGGNDPKALIPDIFGKTNHFRDEDEEWDFSADEPDVVIVSLGTNDYRFAGEGRTKVLIAAATGFLSTIRDTYPDAEIIWIYGQMLNQYDKELEEMVNSFDDPHISYYTVPRCVSGGFGHPDAAGHEEYAAFLAEKIGEKCGK